MDIKEKTEISEREQIRKEWLIVAVMTFLFAVLVFFRLGSLSAPETYLELSPNKGNSHELVLDMGEEKDIASISIYLGHMMNRILAISYFDPEEDRWVVIDEDMEMESIYNWNEIAINQRVQYIGIVSRNGNAVYHEIIVKDTEGNKILPVNANAYAKLFDEQDKYPETVTYYYGTMFDEVYYAGSAYEFLHGMSMLEVTHPPMGKILIALGELLFGTTPFGWRFISALCGILMLPVMFSFLSHVLKNRKAAMAGTALLGLDFMHFTLSRIATLDSMIAFFILLMFTLMYRLLEAAKKELEAGKKRPSGKVLLWMLSGAVTTGMAVSTKWTGFYAMAGIAIFFMLFICVNCVKQKGKQAGCGYLVWMLAEGICLFGLIPLGIYTLAFLPMTLAAGESNVFKTMWEQSFFMLDFHKDIVFEHPYESPWYAWLIDYKPLVDASDLLPLEKVSMVVTMGNPVIWWSGIAAFFHMLYRMIFKRDKKAAYLCLSYFFMLCPWFFVKRTVFIYQYYGSTLFMMGMIAYSLTFIEKKWKSVIPIFLEIALCLFILFFPIISGLPIGSHYMAWFTRTFLLS